MNIQHEAYDDAGRFYFEENNDTIGELDYGIKDNILLIVHTEVDDDLGGKGIGRQLVMAAVDFARKNSIQINATCSFAKKELETTEAFADVYKADKT